jgi:hypothetical protein
VSFADISVLDLTSSGLLGLAVIMILTGLIVPRRTHVDKSLEADRWREAYEVEREARAVAEAQSRELIERTRRIHDNFNIDPGESRPISEG